MSERLIVSLDARGHYFELHYTQGARLADVFIDATIVDCTQVGHFDWSTSSQHDELDRAELSEALARWIADNGDDYLRELPYLNGGQR